MGSGPWRRQRSGAQDAEEIGTVDRIPEFITRAKDKNDPLPPDGLRPPRLQELRSAREGHAGASATRCSTNSACTTIRCSKVALELERIALQDEYFIEKKLYPNIDFYSGITLKALGFPTSMFTALFALARTVGWIAQWNEMIEDPHQKIGRPRQLYTGAKQRDYVPVDQR